MNKSVIYTGIFGNYDYLREPKSDIDCDLICFTDNKNLRSKRWQVIYIGSNKSPNIMNREIKILPHKFLNKYEQSLYIDGNITLIKEPSELFNKYLHKNEMAAPIHDIRNCIFEESKEIVRLGKATKYDIETQIRNYRASGMPEEFGLYEMNVIFRKHNDKKIIQLMELWWEHFNKYSKRDQISFMYSCWLEKFKPRVCFESTRTYNKYFVITPHISNKRQLIKNKFKINYIRYIHNNLVVKYFG